MTTTTATATTTGINTTAMTSSIDDNDDCHSHHHQCDDQHAKCPGHYQQTTTDNDNDHKDYNNHAHLRCRCRQPPPMRCPARPMRSRRLPRSFLSLLSTIMICIPSCRLNCTLSCCDLRVLPNYSLTWTHCVGQTRDTCGFTRATVLLFNFLVTLHSI